MSSPLAIDVDPPRRTQFSVDRKVTEVGSHSYSLSTMLLFPTHGLPGVERDLL